MVNNNKLYRRYTLIRRGLYMYTRVYMCLYQTKNNIVYVNNVLLDLA